MFSSGVDEGGNSNLAFATDIASIIYFYQKVYHSIIFQKPKSLDIAAKLSLLIGLNRLHKQNVHTIWSSNKTKAYTPQQLSQTTPTGRAADQSDRKTNITSFDDLWLHRGT